MKGLRILLAVGIPVGLFLGWVLSILGWREATRPRREPAQLRADHRRFVGMPAR
jgi:hypothetical protein